MKPTINGSPASPDFMLLSREKIRELQWVRLQSQIAYNYANSPFYRERFDASGISPEDINSWSDFARVPVMDKHDHRQAQQASIERYGHPFGMLACVGPEQFVMLSGTSGTTGTPTFYTVTERDLALYSALKARKFKRLGLRPGDRVLHGFALSMMVGGQPLLQTLKNYGACVVPVGAEVGSRRLLEMARLVRPRMLVCTPSYAEYLADKCPEILGIPAEELGIEILMCGGEPGAGLPEMRRKIETAYGAKLYDYTGVIHTFHGLSCTAPNSGMHFLSEDYCVLELLDPETKKPIEVRDGAVGEMVYTELGIEASPLMRYALGDIIEISDKPCRCGWRGLSFKIMGRADDMLIVKGVNVYPGAIRSIVAGFAPRTTGYMRVVLDRPGHKVTPPLQLVVEHAADMSNDAMQSLVDDLKGIIHDRLKFTPDIHLVPPETLSRSTHKTKLVEVRGVDSSFSGRE